MSWALDLAKERLAENPSYPLFGVIIYTDTQPNIKKVLRDPDYWKALDEISGPKWSVFSVRADSGGWDVPDLPDGYLGHMIPVWKEPSSNKELLSAFELDDSSSLPLLAVFALSDMELSRVAIPLNESSCETAFSSLKEAFLGVNEVLSGLETTSNFNSDTVVKEVERKFKRHQSARRLKKAYLVLKEIRSWLPL